VEVIRALLNHEANPLIRNKKDRMTAHEIARNRNHPEAAKLLGDVTVRAAIDRGDITEALRHIRLGGDPNVQTKTGWTALMLAAYQELPETCLELIQLGAKLELEESDGWTAIMFAIHVQNYAIVKLLIEKSANINHVNHEGFNCLDLAKVRVSQHIVDLLLQSGANVTTESELFEEEYQERLREEERMRNQPLASIILLVHPKTSSSSSHSQTASAVAVVVDYEATSGEMVPSTKAVLSHKVLFHEKNMVVQ
jgi:hypothetical protein